MNFIKLEAKCSKKSPTLPSVDPDPNWTFDSILSELQQLESNLGLQTPSPLKRPPIQSQSRNLKVEAFLRPTKAFVMKVLDFDTNNDDDDSEDESNDGISDDSDMSPKGVRFSCVGFDLSDSEGSEVDLDINISMPSLLNKKSLEEGILLEFDREHQLKYKEQVRTALSALEIHNQKEYEMSEHSMHQIEKYIEDRREIDRQVDMQHQQKIAEVLGSHLSALQKDHEEKSQIEERRLKDAVALEAERKKMALQEEKLRREKTEREKAAKLAEENRLAQEAAKRAAAEEAAKKESERVAAEAAMKADADLRRERQRDSKDSERSGIEVMAADIALKLEEDRLKVYNDVAKDIPNIPSKDLNKYGRRMFRVVSQITGSQTDVRDKSYEFIHLLNDSVFTPSVRCLIFAQKVLSFCETPRADDDRVVFALARVIILVSSQIAEICLYGIYHQSIKDDNEGNTTSFWNVPAVMDFVLAEFYKACIYTVPKHLRPLNAAAKNNNYWKMVGYREENDKMESSDSYLKRIELTMKLFAALIQTEIQGIRNPYGLEQGWAWLAMFLNEIPPLRASAFALDAFLRMAGHGLYRRYKSQFVKMLNIISKSYLPALKKKDDPSISVAVKKLENYLEGRVYMKEPEELHLQVQESLSSQLF